MLVMSCSILLCLYGCNLEQQVFTEVCPRCAAVTPSSQTLASAPPCSHVPTPFSCWVLPSQGYSHQPVLQLPACLSCSHCLRQPKVLGKRRSPAAALAPISSPMCLRCIIPLLPSCSNQRIMLQQIVESELQHAQFFFSSYPPTSSSLSGSAVFIPDLSCSPAWRLVLEGLFGLHRYSLKNAVCFAPLLFNWSTQNRLLCSKCSWHLMNLLWPCSLQPALNHSYSRRNPIPPPNAHTHAHTHSTQLNFAPDRPFNLQV